MSNIIQEAKYKIYNSELMLYFNDEKIEKIFKKIYVYDNKEEFLRTYGRNYDENDRLEGFNRSSGSYLGPDATAHTVIHEVLHALSSEFDEKGHRTKAGIVGDGSLKFANQVDEGLTDYLAAKLSGEAPRHYIQGHKLFSKLEPIIKKYTNNPNILMQIYLTNDVRFLKNFLNYFGKENTFENLYNNFLFMNDNEINDMLQKVDKNLNKYLKRKDRKEKRQKFFRKVKNIFTRKEEQKLLTDGRIYYNDKRINLHEQFVNQYNINNFESTMTQNDIEKYNQYQHLQNNQQQYDNGERYH